ncbi:hypothetical protein LSM04_006369 [Trypanosoma melophagium]|uniref:uncharacterized protein n=1 Tax=Trypanosoma melophagium TaxID=715481 RepID=UPI00351A0878|nr:hypothetical protein LSM04_006369 [Trypanosoma melophagium]
MACDRMSEFLSFSGNRKYHKTLKSNTESSRTRLPINEETKSVFSTLDDIRQLMTTVALLHNARLIDSTIEKREVVHDTMEKINLLCHSCREKIITYDRKTKERERELVKGIPSINTAELRMRYNIASFMEHQLMREVRNIWMVQKRHEEKLVESTARRIKARFMLTHNNSGDNQNSMDNSSVVEESQLRELAQQVLATGNEGRLFFLARDELERVMQTRNAVLELEQEMQDLLNLFSDLYFLVNDQHDRLIKVQENIEQYNRNLERGMTQLKEAKHHQKRCCNVI